MIDENNLSIGNCYFMVAYFDNEMRVPDIETYIYVGKNVLPADEDADEDSWYFQDPETYLQKGPFFESKSKKGFDILRVTQVTLELMYDLKGVISALVAVEGKRS